MNKRKKREFPLLAQRMRQYYMLYVAGTYFSSTRLLKVLSSENQGG
jgi:hypothetical protein